MKILPIVNPSVKFFRFVNRASHGDSSMEQRMKVEDKYRTFFDYLKFLDIVILLIECVLAVAALVYYESLFIEQFQSWEQYIAIVVVISTISIIAIKVIRNHLVKKNEELMHFIYPKNIFGANNGLAFYFEILLYCCFPNPIFGLDAIKTVILYSDRFDVSLEYPLNAFLVVIVVMRFTFYALPRFLVFGGINEMKYRRIAYVYGIEENSSYLSKYYLNNHTLLLSMVVYSIGIIVFAFCIKILERPNPIYDFNNILKTLYFMYITFASVGYGEIVPITIPGKLLTIFSFILGFLTTSMLTYSLINTLNFVDEETKTFNLFEKSQIERDLEIEIINFFFYLRRLTNLSLCKPVTTTRLLVPHYLQKFYNSYRRLKSHKLEFKMLEGIIQNNQGEATKQRLELYFDIFYKEIEKANKHQQEISKMTRRWLMPAVVKRRTADKRE